MSPRTHYPNGDRTLGYGEGAKWHDLSARMGRNDKPATLINAVAHGTLVDPNEIAKGVAEAWTGAEWPCRIAPEWVWKIMFERACPDEMYLLDEGAKVLRDSLPEGGLELWRGAWPEFAGGMSWTDNREIAEWFCKRWEGTGGTPGCLYAATVPREYVLGMFDHRGESEVVVDWSALMEDDIERVLPDGSREVVDATRVEFEEVD